MKKGKVNQVGSAETEASGICNVEMLDIDVIKPFRHHPFHLYEGERLDDMVESIKEHGILNPVIVRKMHYGYPCAYPGCPELTDGRYCEKHRKKVNQNYEKYGRDKKRSAGMEDAGSGSVTYMLQSIRSVNCVMSVE